MRFGIALPNYGALAQPETLVALAHHADELGIHSVWVSDHLVAPTDVRSVYPYDRRPDPQPGDMGVIKWFCEPMVTLAYLAGHTRRVRLGISAYVMPYRNPLITAKQVATLDYLCGGRVILAVGSGWLREEFDALGVPFSHRGARTEEYLSICTSLWSTGTAHFAGSHYKLRPVTTGPLPTQRPRPPVWIAGNSRAAIDRAARLGDGWHAIDLSPAELAPLVQLLRERTTAHGRAPDAVTVSLRKGVLPASDGTVARPLYGTRAAIRADLDAYRAAGLNYLVAGLRQAKSSSDLLQAMHDVAETLAP